MLSSRLASHCECTIDSKFDSLQICLSLRSFKGQADLGFASLRALKFNPHIERLDSSDSDNPAAEEAGKRKLQARKALGFSSPTSRTPYRPDSFSKEMTVPVSSLRWLPEPSALVAEGPHEAQKGPFKRPYKVL